MVAFVHEEGVGNHQVTPRDSFQFWDECWRPADRPITANQVVCLTVI